jgi:hypothetical protein
MIRHMEVTIGDFIQASRDAVASAGAGGMITTAVPCGPGGQTRACVINGIYLIEDGEDRLAIMLQPVSRGIQSEVVLSRSRVRRRPGSKRCWTRSGGWPPSAACSAGR